MKDTPLSYTMSSGKEMDFTFYYRMRTKLPDSDEVPNYYFQSRSDLYPGVSNCGTNAAWGNNWNLSVVLWDKHWETSWSIVYMPQGNDYLYTPPAFAPFSDSYEAMVMEPEGGLLYFNIASPTMRVQDTNSLVQYLPVSANGYPTGTSTPAADANEIYWGDAGAGVKLVHPDGSQEIFGLTAYFAVTNGYTERTDTGAGVSNTRFLLTQRIDPQGRTNHLGYERIVPPLQYQYAYRLKYVVDPDGRTNTFLYTTTNGFQIAEIDDPYGRKATVGYSSDPSTSGLLNRLTDAAGLTNTFQYLPGPLVTTTNWCFRSDGTIYICGYSYSYGPSDGWVDQLTTPYGNTAFCYYEVPETDVPDGFQQRALYVTEPNGAQQLYFYDHVNSGEPDTDTAPSAPGQTFDDGNSGTVDPSLIHRNSYQWGRLQFEALSANYNLNEGLGEAMTYQSSNPSFSQSEFASALGALTTGNYNAADLKHWLLGSDGISIAASLSSERDPSPDAAGTIRGLRTWYNYANKPSGEPEEIGSDPRITCIARVLPGGSSQYTIYNYYPLSGIPNPPAGAGFVSNNISSDSKPDGTIGTLTNWFTYAANSVDLVSISNSIGQYVNAGYNGNHEITSLTNALQQVTMLSWDSSTFNLTGIQWPGGKSYTLNYYSPATPPTSTSSMLQELSVSPEGRTLIFNTYQAGNPAIVTDDRGLTVTNTFDGLNRLTGTGFPDGTSVSNVYYRLDLAATKDRMTHWTYYGYDGLRHLTSATNANGAVTTYGWCGCGSLTSVLDATLTNLTTLNYDNQGNLTNILYPDNTSLTYQFDLAGRMTNESDGVGRALQLRYNNQGLVTNVAGAYGTLQSAIYDAVNRPISVTDANGVTVTNQYDAINELLKRGWPDGSSEGFGYSTNGLVAYTNQDQKVTFYARDGAGRLLAVTNANWEVTQFAYDSLNNLTNLTDGNTNHTQWQYDVYGWLTNKIDGLSHNVFSLAHNADGWVTNRWLPASGNTVYTYDPVGNLKTVAYPSASISYSYDVLDHLTNMVDASGTNVFGYTPTGQLQSETGPWPNDTVSFVYDQMLRTNLTITQSGGSWIQKYQYDAAWRMTNIVSPAGAFGYGYTFQPASSLITSISLPNGAGIANGYDGLARLTQTSLNNQWGHALDAYTYVPDPLGLRTNVVRNLGLTSSSVTAEYDGIGQLTNWVASETNGTLRWNERLGFGYDPAHNLHVRSAGSLVQTFRTDAANELTNVASAGPLTLSGATPVPAVSVTVNGQAAQVYGDFTFARTNLAMANGLNSFTTIAENIHGLLTTNTLTINLLTNVSLAFDGNGNLTNDGTRSFRYDAENQLTNVTVAGQWQMAMVYDGLNRRRIIRDYSWNGTTWILTNEVRYLYDGNLPIQERDTNGNVLVTYTRGVDFGGGIGTAGGIGGLLARTDENGSTFYHADGSGNITALMNGSGNIVARYLYNPFGKLIGQWGSMANANEMQFSSMPQHDGLSLYPYRAYEPNFQRWLNQDPIQEAGGINLYTYVNDSPLNYIDPLGFAPTVFPAVGVGTSTGSSGGAGVVRTIVNGAEGAAEIAGAGAADELGGDASGAAIMGSLPFLGIMAPGNDPDADPNGVNAPPNTASSILPPKPPKPPKGSSASCPNSPNGDNEHNARGREAHKWWDPGPGYQKEFRFSNGAKADAINFKTRNILELKPNNPDAIAQGEAQLQRYINQAQRQFGGNWTGNVVLY